MGAGLPWHSFVRAASESVQKLLVSAIDRRFTLFYLCFRAVTRSLDTIPHPCAAVLRFSWSMVAEFYC